MPSRKRTSTRRTAKKTTAAKQNTMTPEEVEELESQVDSHRKTENAWFQMTEAAPEEDPYGDVEEHLLNKPHESQHAARRWKYFSK